MDLRGWHFDKTISITHLFTTLTIACSVMVWANSVDKRLTLLEREQEHQLEVDRRQDDVMREALTMIRDSLKELNHKVDRLQERRR